MKNIYSYKILKNLTTKLKKNNGRNNQGLITVRHKGGGLKKRYKLVDYTKFFMNLKGIILINNIYDSFRSSFISLILYKNGIFSLILKPRLLNEGDTIALLNTFCLGVGNSFPLRVVPDGVFLYSLEYKQGEYAKIARAAGAYIYIVNKFTRIGNKVLIRFRSKEEYLLNCNILGIMGRLDNINHRYFKYKKAGINRRRGIRPTVRGVSMNPIDHFHGGRSYIGGDPVSIYGKLAKGGRTRKQLINKNIYKRRNG